MGRAWLAGNPPIEINLRRSARARRVSLRVSGLDGKVTLSLPRGMNEAEALAFAEEKSGWIRRHLDRQADPVAVGVGGDLPFRGETVRVAANGRRRTEFRDGAIRVPEAPALVAPRLKAFLVAEARVALTAASRAHAEAIGRRFGRITLRDTRSRWGSCSAKGDLMYSWRLIMAPPEVLDYVAAHEVAHLAELNHSPAFWAVVRRICPGYEAPRRWLRENGPNLHRFRFGD